VKLAQDNVSFGFQVPQQIATFSKRAVDIAQANASLQLHDRYSLPFDLANRISLPRRRTRKVGGTDNCRLVGQQVTYLLVLPYVITGRDYVHTGIEYDLGVFGTYPESAVSIFTVHDYQVGTMFLDQFGHEQRGSAESGLPDDVAEHQYL
jgi:hypothetical protein